MRITHLLVSGLLATAVPVQFAIADLDQGGRSITNDAAYVVRALNEQLNQRLNGRRLFYRDSMGRFDELVVVEGKFAGYVPCSNAQQQRLASLAFR